jgi:hypothetical protein
MDGPPGSDPINERLRSCCVIDRTVHNSAMMWLNVEAIITATLIL